MDALDLIARIVLALVFALSGAAKLRDPQGTRRAMRDFGMPRLVVPVAAGALPLIEIAITLLLLPPATALWAAVAAIALLLAFTTAIGWQLARGKRPDCHCFGALSGGPIGAKTLARNGLLLALGIGVAVLTWDAAAVPGFATGEPALLATVAALGGVLLLGAGAQVVLVYTVYQRLSRRLVELDSVVRTSHDRAQRRIAGEVVPPVVGEPAAVLELPDLRGAMFDLASMRGRELLLVFVRPGCWACHAILPDLLERAAKPPPDDADLVVIARGSPDENQDLQPLQAPVLLSPSASVAAAFGVAGTPAALRIDGSGRVASDLAIGIDQVRRELNPELLQSHEPAQQASGGSEWLRGLTTSTHRLIDLVRGSI
jgi:uncharacterized membrane protein YphA (DoxX/SURF4 family)